VANKLGAAVGAERFSDENSHATWMVCKTTIPQFKSGWHLEEARRNPAGF
jgi:hypothetical protein